MKKLGLVLISLLFFGCSTTPQKTAMIGGRSPSSTDDSAVAEAPMDGVIWNAEAQLAGLDSINVAWQKTDDPKILRLRHFYLNDLSLRGALLPVTYRFLPAAELTFNTATGVLFLGDQPVGHWNGHPAFRGAYLDGFLFDGHFAVDQKDKTVNLLPGTP